MMSELGARDGERVCGCKGRPEDADEEHCQRVRRIQHPVQRHRAGIHRDAADGAAAGAPGGRKPPPVRPVHHRKDAGGAVGGTTEDLVGPAVFLASDASNFVNGHVLYVDGGILAYIGKQPK